jgi:8-oxo-dGTP diphosphatase
MILLRHASAGDSSKWEGDDNERPLDKRGVGQAKEIVDQLAPFTIDRIVSSPAARCVQTVEPLAHARGLQIEERSELGQDRSKEEWAACVRSFIGTQAVVCGHGGFEAAIPGAPELKKGAFFVVG